ANWKQGEDVIIVPSVDNETAKKLFPEGWTEHRPYLRTVRQPRLG
ncbi:MAG TPA: peroxiredoxin, partial [Phenylobacterium sp.]|nr:peroxiredoxin [Phenylobacterium sp.]